jgi:membrane protease YdiL (CAAX protease family)
MDEAVETLLPTSAPEQVECWRCGKLIAATSAACPVCRARVSAAAVQEGAVTQSAPGAKSNSATARRKPDSAMPPAAERVLYYFLALLGLSVAQRFIAAIAIHGAADPERVQQWLTASFEAVDSVLILLAVWRLPRPAAPAPLSASHRAAGWLAGPPLLFAALAVNLAYHHLLRSFTSAPDWLTRDQDMAGQSIAWLALTICVQPAIFEELFFRYLTLGHLRSVMGVHAAVWVSSLIFGLAHLGVPLSIPALIVVGVALGYARVWSGSLLLPMLMHFAHNLVVVFLELNS